MAESLEVCCETEPRGPVMTGLLGSGGGAQHEDRRLEPDVDDEFYRNPFAVPAMNAAATERIRLGTGIAGIVSRTPSEMANAANVDEISCGRTILDVAPGALGGLM